jgi:hypothetical protein
MHSMLSGIIMADAPKKAHAPYAAPALHQIHPDIPYDIRRMEARRDSDYDAPCQSSPRRP